MAIKKIGLVWVTASDIKKAQNFFVDKLGLTLKQKDETYGWLELAGKEGGALLGVGQSNEEYGPEVNAIVTFTVDNIEETRNDLIRKGVDVDEIMEVPGHVKLASFTDPDGNKYQLAEELSSK